MRRQTDIMVRMQAARITDKKQMWLTGTQTKPTTAIQTIDRFAVAKVLIAFC